VHEQRVREIVREELARVNEFHAAGWAIWNKLQEEADKNQTA